MYLHRYGLSREPFSIAPDPRFLYLSERHREALAHLLYGLQGNGGFVILTGEVGAGKTTLCRGLLEQAEVHGRIAYIFNPRLTELELLQTVCDEFGLEVESSRRGSIKVLIDALNAFLLAEHAGGRRCVLVIDEAQNLSDGVLEQLRLLTNLETTERKLLLIVLVGQPELREMLARPQLAALAQRVIARYHLEPLSADDTRAYVRHRLRVAGATDPLPLGDAAVARVHAITAGVPRRINLLCDRGLLAAYAADCDQVNPDQLDAAAVEVGLAAARPKASPATPAWRQTAVGAAFGAALGAVAVAMWLHGRGLPAHAPVAAAGPAPDTPSLLAQPAVPNRSSGALEVRASRTDLRNPPAIAAEPRRTHLPELWPRLHDDIDGAWHQLARHWDPASPAPPAGNAPRVGGECPVPAPLRCWRGNITLAQAMALDRPALLLLRNAAGSERAALLRSLDTQDVVVETNDGAWQLSRAELALAWSGDYATLWRAPEGWPAQGAPEPNDAIVAWLEQQLDAAMPRDASVPSANWRDRLIRFQRAQGLKPDGLPGPMTVMQLNRALGVHEPRLEP
jgi:general secretion pathway protein A